MTKLSATLPKEWEDDGLASLNPELVNSPEETHLVICIVDCKSITKDVDSGFEIATARILQIEALTDPGAAEQARELLQLAKERRTGSKRLPVFDTHDEVDDETGEITSITKRIR